MTQLTIEIPEELLLSSIWYSDGSGARRGSGIGVDATPDEWTITSIERVRDIELVRISLERKPL